MGLGILDSLGRKGRSLLERTRGAIRRWRGLLLQWHLPVGFQRLLGLEGLDRQGGRDNLIGLAVRLPPCYATPGASVPEGQLTCRRKVIGCWPMAWASPMLARMTSVNGFLIP